MYGRNIKRRERIYTGVITVNVISVAPKIKNIPNITVEKGKPARLICNAECPSGDDIQGYIWYETTTGKIQDIIAIDRGNETNDYLDCDTNEIGERYYACMATSPNGEFTYSNIIKVTVIDTIQETESQTEANEDTPDDTTSNNNETSVKEDTTDKHQDTTSSITDNSGTSQTDNSDIPFSSDSVSESDQTSHGSDNFSPLVPITIAGAIIILLVIALIIIKIKIK